MPGCDEVLQIKVWLLGVSPMIWRRVQVPASLTLRQMHGVLQVAMGWEGIHPYQFCLRAACYGSSDLGADSPDVTLAELKLPKGARFVYEYDLNIPWSHEVRVEDKLEPEPGRPYPQCIGGGGHCPPEECAGLAGFMDNRDALISLRSFEDLQIMVGIARKVLLEERPEILRDEETRWELEGALERSRARELARGKPFSRRTVPVSRWRASRTHASAVVSIRHPQENGARRFGRCQGVSQSPTLRAFLYERGGVLRTSSLPPIGACRERFPWRGRGRCWP